MKLLLPFAKIDRRLMLLVYAAEVTFGLILWSVFRSELIPGPLDVAKSIVEIVSTWRFWDNLFISIALSFKAIVAACVIALLISYLNFVAVFKPISDTSIKLRYLPLSALIFVVMILIPNAGQMKLWLLIFGIVPFFVTSMIASLNDVPETELDLCRTLRMSPWQTLWESMIRGRIHVALDTVKQNFAICLSMIMMVEGLNMAGGGIGTALIKAARRIDISVILANLSAIIFFGLIIDYALGLFKKLIFPYTK